MRLRESSRILLVDDEPGIIQAEARLLKKAGYEAVICTSGEEALELIARESFDVIVTDITMPSMSGLELLRKLREIERDIPVILRTGGPTVESAAEAVEHGALKYLVKPVAFADLLQGIRRGIHLNRLADARRMALEALHGQSSVAQDREGLEADFTRALDGLWMAFQPIVSADGGGLYGYEALMRSTELRLPHPGAVLSAAESLGRLPELGRLIRERALSALSPSDDWALFLNLHPNDLSETRLMDQLMGWPELIPRIVLEVTERASLEKVPEARHRIAELREAGCRIAIDDLGAGYAGLSSFVELEPDIVKLDMSLVRDVDKSPMKKRLIASLTSVCRDLGFLVVGEGVETADERDVLVELGCDLLQGYHFGRPERGFAVPKW